MKSLGFVEVSGVVAAVDALDIMCKSADVALVSWERKLGGRLVTLIITGNVSAVKAAVDAACESCIKKPVATAVIANPHSETIRLVQLSAKRLENKTSKKAEAPVQKKVEAPVESAIKAPAVEAPAKTAEKQTENKAETVVKQAAAPTQATKPSGPPLKKTFEEISQDTNKK